MGKEIIDIKQGLNEEQIKERIDKNLVNIDTSVPTKSIKQIVRENFVTLFNILNLFLGIAVFLVGSYKNMLFLLIVIINTAISTAQEIYSKKMVDKLSILNTKKVIAIRNSKKEEILVNEIVLDDILELETGNQVSVDCKIEDGMVEIDESFITGESDTIYKEKGETILSGSIIISGRCIAQVEHIGEENYTAQISKGAKYIKNVKSEMMRSLNKIIKILTFTIIPIGALLFSNQYFILQYSLKESVVKTVAAMIGMIPEGLVLLTSTVLAVSVIRLSKRKVLVQDLYCIETLARVDTLCLDKTGTLTEGKMEVNKYLSVNDDKEFENIVSNFAKTSQDTNSTMLAVKDKFNKVITEFKTKKIVPFSSQTKFSAVEFEEKGTYILGAPEIVLKQQLNKYEKEVIKESKEYRILALIKTQEIIEEKEKKLPKEYEVLGFIYLTDKIRKEAKDTLNYFKEQGVDIKIISGDNPITVSQIAKRVGLESYENYIDMSTLKSDEQIKEVAIKYNIFGRVTPPQKKALIVALKEQGKTVAMTGDGVNDVLALKEADCSIAMANGSDATKNVSKLILLDSNFASMPQVVLEGRRSINNLERSASLFLVKTIYSLVLSFVFLIIGKQYPFMPIQLSLISTTTIGVPSFLLALEPNKDRVKGNFFKNVIKKAVPTALTVILSILTIGLGYKYGKISEEIYSSLCVIAAGFSAILLLITLTRSRKNENKKYPISRYRLTIAILVILLFIAGLTLLSWWFSIASLAIMIKEIIFISIVCIVDFIVLNILMNKCWK